MAKYHRNGGAQTMDVQDSGTGLTGTYVDGMETDEATLDYDVSGSRMVIDYVHAGEPKTGCASLLLYIASVQAKRNGATEVLISNGANGSAWDKFLGGIESKNESKMTGLSRSDRLVDDIDLFIERARSRALAKGWTTQPAVTAPFVAAPVAAPRKNKCCGPCVVQ